MSFSVIFNLLDKAGQLIREKTGKTPASFKPFPPNTKVVLAATAFLLVIGTFLTYGIEHSNTLRNLSIGQQYLNAFFQSVTYRTAGFNTLPFGNLRIPTYFIIILFMFIGGASGSTAGGIKINTAVVILNFIRSAFRGKEEVNVFQHRIAFEVVTRAFLILILGLVAVFTGTVILTITENAPLVTILFETVSAFGTVGLSAGLTPALSPVGKMVIILLMYIGRTGPLTLVAAAAIRRGVKVNYPIANIAIG